MRHGLRSQHLREARAPHCVERALETLANLAHRRAMDADAYRCWRITSVAGEGLARPLEAVVANLRLATRPVA
jgi:hypothetical protein